MIKCYDFNIKLYIKKRVNFLLQNILNIYKIYYTFEKEMINVYLIDVSFSL